MRYYNLNELSNMLDFFEVSKTTPLLLHSSLIHLGLLKDVPIEKIGTVLVDFFTDKLENFNQPMFNYTFPKTNFMDLTLPNSEVGTLANIMFQKGYFRTSHPMFSFVGNNKNFIKPNFVEKNPFGKDSFFDRLTKNDGIVIVLGAKPFVATYIIYAEFMAKVKFRFLKSFCGSVVLQNHKTVHDCFCHFAFPLNGGYRHNYCKFHNYLLEKNISKEFKIGASKAYGFKTKDFVTELKNYIKDEPFRLLDKKPKYFYDFINNQETIIAKVK